MRKAVGMVLIASVILALQGCNMIDRDKESETNNTIPNVNNTTDASVVSPGSVTSGGSISSEDYDDFNNTTGNSVDVTDYYSRFETGLTGLGYNYQMTTRSATTLGGAEGRRYKWDNNDFEVYRFDKNSDKLRTIANNKKLTAKGYENHNVEVYGDYVVVSRETLGDKIRDLFRGFE